MSAREAIHAAAEEHGWTISEHGIFSGFDRPDRHIVAEFSDKGICLGADRYLGAERLPSARINRRYKDKSARVIEWLEEIR